MDVLLAPPVVDAIDAAVRSGDTGYTAGSAFAEAVRDFAADRWQWTVDVDATSTVPDVMRGMTELVRLLTAPGDNVIVTPPIYPPFYGFMRSARRQLLSAPLTPAGRLDLTSLESAFDAATRTGRPSVLLLSNPHNPTGVVHTVHELAAVADLATTHGVRVISDEIHAPLVLPGAKYTPYLTVPQTETGFALISGSKGWNLAGLKAALAIAGSAAATDLRRLPVEVPLGASHLGVIAQTAAFTHGRHWLDTLIADLDLNRSLLRSLLQEHLPAVHYIPPAATFLAWLDFTELMPRFGSHSPTSYFLDNARVALNPSEPYGVLSPHTRLNFATNPKVLTLAIKRMARSLQASGVP